MIGRVQILSGFGADDKYIGAFRAYCFDVTTSRPVTVRYRYMTTPRSIQTMSVRMRSSFQLLT